MLDNNAGVYTNEVQHSLVINMELSLQGKKFFGACRRNEAGGTNEQ